MSSLNNNNNHKERLLKNGEMASNQNNKLKEAKANILEVESTAIKVQEQLYKNTETLGRSIENVFFIFVLFINFCFFNDFLLFIEFF